MWALFKAFHTLHFLYSSRFRIHFVLESIPNFNDMKIPSKKVSVKNLKIMKKMVKDKRWRYYGVIKVKNAS